MKVRNLMLMQKRCGVCGEVLDLSQIDEDTVICRVCKRVWTREEIREGGETMPEAFIGRAFIPPSLT